MSQKQPRLDSGKAVIGLGLLFAAGPLLHIKLQGLPMSRSTVALVVLLGWFAAWVALRVGDHLIDRLERHVLAQEVSAGSTGQDEAAAVETRPCTADELLVMRVDRRLPRHVATRRCGTCGHLAVLATDGWTHYAVLDNHPVAPEAVPA